MSSPAPSGKGTVEKAFAISASPTKRPALKKGAQATVYYSKDGNVAKRVDLTESLRGLLTPGDSPAPPSACREIPPDALRLYLGSNVAWTTGQEAVALRIGSTDILSLRRTSRGMALNATGFDPNGNVAYQIVDNHFFVNARNYFIEEPDPHTLTVRDERKTEVLAVRYLNPTSIAVTGIFNYLHRVPIVITEEQITVGGNNTMSGNCIGNFAVAIDVP